MNDAVRRLILLDVISRMSDEEKRNCVQMLTKQREHQEVMEALQRQGVQIDQIAQNNNWKTDFLSDVGANLLTDSFIWLGSRLFPKL